MHVNDLLRIAIARNASDLHLKVGSYPMTRVNGQLVPVAEANRLTREDTEAFSTVILSQHQRARFEETRELDLAYSVAGLGRFRCSIFQQRGTTGLVLRILPVGVRSLDELTLPPALKKICVEERGLVLVTGTTGSGKTTTLAAMVDHINHARPGHILTIEDPIEYLHRDVRSIVNQREVATDTPSFGSALRTALRQDPDVILVGEMRDLETIETGLLAAETGHLVLSTLHTLDATETIHRIIAVFPVGQQTQIRYQLATVLKAVISLRLVPRADGCGRCPAVEVMVGTPFIRDCIIDPARTDLIRGAIAAGTSQYGMQTFDQALYWLYEQGTITFDEALRWATNVDEFKLKVQGISNLVESAREEMARAAADSPDITRFTRTKLGAPVARDAYTTALRLLARRDLTRAQLTNRLRRRQLPDEEIRVALDRLEQHGAQDDSRVALAFARTAARVRRFGRLRTLRELSAMGIARDLGKRAVAEIYDEVDEAALMEHELARLATRALRTPADYARVARALARRGFAADLIRRALGRRGAPADADD
ncbi:MAG: RecX family transcriptional regulator [Acidobacteria bacterium]|nr:RecX family transcriptional regulator [Acidobacteriota bacterium]